MQKKKYHIKYLTGTIVGGYESSRTLTTTKTDLLERLKKLASLKRIKNVRYVEVNPDGTLPSEYTEVLPEEALV
jgi:Ser/Thr protein kinase RdoA (MazF antagonist)